MHWLQHIKRSANLLSAIPKMCDMSGSKSNLILHGVHQIIACDPFQLGKQLFELFDFPKESRQMLARNDALIHCRA